jgi:hypothetical protein
LAAVHLDASRIENVRSGKQTKSHLLTSSASGLRSQCRAHSVLGTFPFVRIKPEDEASHIAATVTAKILDQKGGVFTAGQSITAPLPLVNSSSIPYGVSPELNHSRYA